MRALQKLLLKSEQEHNTVNGSTKLLDQVLVERMAHLNSMSWSKCICCEFEYDEIANILNSIIEANDILTVTGSL